MWELQTDEPVNLYMYVSVPYDRQDVVTQDAPSTTQPAHHVRIVWWILGGRDDNNRVPTFM